MRTLTFLAACVVVFLCSCGKNPLLAPGSSISATINGIPEKFNFIDSVGYSNTGTWYTMTVTGKSSAADSADMIELSVFSKTPITTGTYSYLPTTQQELPPSTVLIVYKLKSSTNFLNDYVVDSSAGPITITISQLSKTHVQGTFSGTLAVAAGDSGSTKVFTDGVFDLGSK
jgi:hypothetical protein